MSAPAKGGKFIGSDDGTNQRYRGLARFEGGTNSARGSPKMGEKRAGSVKVNPALHPHAVDHHHDARHPVPPALPQGMGRKPRGPTLRSPHDPVEPARTKKGKKKPGLLKSGGTRGNARLGQFISSSTRLGGHKDQRSSGTFLLTQSAFFDSVNDSFISKEIWGWVRKESSHQ